MMKSPLFAIMVAILAILAPEQSDAHSGGLNAQGCHGGSKPYHCHRPQNSSAPARRALSGAFIDRNCTDFGSWQEAQRFFEDAGPGDPHGLDADHDNIACEGLQ